MPSSHTFLNAKFRNHGALFYFFFDKTEIKCLKVLLSWLFQVNKYPTLLLYPAGDKSNPVMCSQDMITWFVSQFQFFWWPSTLQVKVSKKSGLKELAAFIKENMRSQDDKTVSSSDQLKDELWKIMHIIWASLYRLMIECATIVLVVLAQGLTRSWISM